LPTQLYFIKVQISVALLHNDDYSAGCSKMWQKSSFAIFFILLHKLELVNVEGTVFSWLYMYSSSQSFTYSRDYISHDSSIV